MKKCSWCGKEYPDDALFCAVYGYALQPVAGSCPPTITSAVVQRQLTEDDEHIRLLSIFHFVVAGLCLIGILFLFAHHLMLHAFVANTGFWNSSKNVPIPPTQFFAIFIWFYFIMGTVLMTASVLNLLSGVFLHQRRHRVFSLVVGGLNCLQIPFGTVLGVFTIVVLSRNSVRVAYDLGQQQGLKSAKL